MNTQFICKLPSKIKRFMLVNFVLHTPKRFWIYSSSIQHTVEKCHCLKFDLARVVKKSLIWSTMSVPLLVKSLNLNIRGLNLSSSLEQASIGFIVKRITTFYFRFDFVVTVYDVVHMSLFFFFVMTCHAEFLLSFYIK